MAQSLSNLPIGAKVKFGKHAVFLETPQDIVWLIVAKNHTGYPTNSVTLWTEKVIDFRAFDANEPSSTSTNRISAGNSNYSTSNIDQWLNKDSQTEWYVDQHTTDMEPSAASVLGGINTPYFNRPGFLYHFSEDEKNAILNTTILSKQSQYDGAAVLSIARKVFLPSIIEVSGANFSNFGTTTVSPAEGQQWSYLSNGATTLLNGYPTEQAITHTQMANKPSSTTTRQNWWTRTSSLSTNNSESSAFVCTNAPMFAPSNANAGAVGIRPALNVSATILASDTTDSDGCYTLTYNSAPPAPAALNLPTTIYGGRNNIISWSSVTDVDGDSITYQLECAYDGGEFSMVYSGGSSSYSHSVPAGTSSIQYRVKATDSYGDSSAYTTSVDRVVVNNQAPTISGADSDLGTKSNGFTQAYSVNDADGDIVTVIEAVDGIEFRSFTATLGETYTADVTNVTWLSLSNAVHTLTITATDSKGNSTVRTYTFVKSVDSFSIRNTAPMLASTMPTRIVVTVTKNIPAEATFLVEVCNNGYDSEPTWEDATPAVTTSMVHTFENTTKTADSWGVVVRITVTRNNGEGACYISAIGGNFE